MPGRTVQAPLLLMVLLIHGKHAARPTSRLCWAMSVALCVRLVLGATRFVLSAVPVLQHPGEGGITSHHEICKQEKRGFN